MGKKAKEPPAEQQTYIVERIYNKAVINGVLCYRVRWGGYTSDDDTWEPYTKLKDYDAAKTYEKECRQRRKTTTTAPAAKKPTGRRTLLAKVEPRARTRQSSPAPPTASRASHRSDKAVGSTTRQRQLTLNLIGTGLVKNKRTIATTPVSRQAVSALNEEDFNDSPIEKAGHAADDGEDQTEQLEVGEDSENRDPEHEDSITDKLEEPFLGKTYEFQAGGANRSAKEVEKVLGVRPCQNADCGDELVALVKYADSTYEIAPTRILGEYCPQKLIALYESRYKVIIDNETGPEVFEK